MTDPPAEYRAIPSSEDQAYDSNVDEAGLGVGGDERVYSTSEQIPTESRTKWSFFLLGCAILLPWNGDVSRKTTRPMCAHVYSVLLNATPFFLSRLAGSPFYPTFSPYLTSVYTVTKLVVQFYCTFTSKQVRRFNRMVIVSEYSRFGIYVAVIQFSPHIRVHYCAARSCHISMSQHVQSRHTWDFFCVCSFQCSLYGGRS